MIVKRQPKSSGEFYHRSRPSHVTGHSVQHVNRKVRIAELLAQLCSPIREQMDQNTLQLYKEMNGWIPIAQRPLCSGHGLALWWDPLGWSFAAIQATLSHCTQDHLSSNLACHMFYICNQWLFIILCWSLNKDFLLYQTSNQFHNSCSISCLYLFWSWGSCNINPEMNESKINPVFFNKTEPYIFMISNYIIK